MFLIPFCKFKIIENRIKMKNKDGRLKGMKKDYHSSLELFSWDYNQIIFQFFLCFTETDEVCRWAKTVQCVTFFSVVFLTLSLEESNFSN